jgi:NAD(P)H-dependent flavin oxidoreductase YrpB (nitropropane dioxygenase family)
MSGLRTPACELFGIDVPIVQTGMGWVAGARLVSATAGAGALGILASATMTYDQLAAAIREVKARTDRPFGVNLRADAEDAEQRVQLLIREQVKVASFALAPSERQIKTLKDAGVCVVPSIGARRHAEKVAGWGADAVIMQGGEGGGHTGPVATTLLLPQVVDAVGIPVIAAGGFFDGRGLVAALAYGAAGVAMGTRFLLTQESTVPDSVKRYYLACTVADTVVTTRIDGVPHRVLRTEFVDDLEHTSAALAMPRAIRNAFAFKRMSRTSWRGIVREGMAMKREGDLKWSQVILAANTPMLLRAGLVEGRLDAGVLSSGQSVGVIDDLPTVAELVERIMSEAEAALKRLADVRLGGAS